MARIARLLGRSLVALGLFLLIARTGVFPDAAYFLLYEAAAAPGRLAGVEERSAVKYFELNCRPYRYPRSIIRLALMNDRMPGVEQTVFTCSDATQ